MKPTKLEREEVKIHLVTYGRWWNWGDPISPVIALFKIRRFYNVLMPSQFRIACSCPFSSAFVLITFSRPHQPCSHLWMWYLSSSTSLASHHYRSIPMWRDWNGWWFQSILLLLFFSFFFKCYSIALNWIPNLLLTFLLKFHLRKMRLFVDLQFLWERGDE